MAAVLKTDQGPAGPSSDGPKLVVSRRKPLDRDSVPASPDPPVCRHDHCTICCTSGSGWTASFPAHVAPAGGGERNRKDRRVALAARRGSRVLRGGRL